MARGIAAERIGLLNNGIRQPEIAAPPIAQRPLPRRLLRPARALQARRPAAARARDARAALPGLESSRSSAAAAERARSSGSPPRSASAGAHALHRIRERRLRDELLAGSRVCVCPSVKEGWGLTVVEANALGRPVVATDAPGLRDAVIHEQTGVLVADARRSGWCRGSRSDRRPARRREPAGAARRRRARVVAALRLGRLRRDHGRRRRARAAQPMTARAARR